MKEILLVLPGFILWRMSTYYSKDRVGLLKTAEWEFILPFSLFGVLSTASSWVFISFLESLNKYFHTGFFSFAIHQYSDDFFYLNFLISCFVAVCLSKAGQRNNPCAQRLCNFFLPEDNREVTTFYKDLTAMGSLIITLKCNKVYYAIPLSVKGDSVTSSYISVIPFASGYRESKHYEIRLTSDYESVLANIEDFNLSPLIVRIPNSEISSILKYDAVNFDYKNNLIC